MATTAKWIALGLLTPFFLALLPMVLQFTWLPLALFLAWWALRSREVGKIRAGLARLEDHANRWSSHK